MTKIQTGIAITLALVVVAVFFVFPGLFPFSTTPSAPADEQGSDLQMQNDSTTTMDISGNSDQLQSVDEIVGTGATAEVGDMVTVKYVGAFTNGTVFDASANHPETQNGFTLTLGAGGVIKGWDEGLVGMKEGGKRKLVIPPALGYGSQDYGPIPGNSTLVFEVELVKVQKAGQ